MRPVEKSNLRLHAPQTPYIRKVESTTEAFSALRTAQAKRYRKALRNLEHALANHIPISSVRTA